MTDEDVTHVTRNSKGLPPELKVVIDLVTGIAMIYYVTHPDCLDNLGDTARRYWDKFVHHVSVWAARQDIRTLPETGDE
jgi:hypothetical protein